MKRIAIAVILILLAATTLGAATTKKKKKTSPSPNRLPTRSRPSRNRNEIEAVRSQIAEPNPRLTPGLGSEEQVTDASECPTIPCHGIA